MQSSKWASPQSIGIAQRSPRGDVAPSPSSPEEKVMYLHRWGLQSLNSFWQKKSGDNLNRAALQHRSSAAGHAGWSCSSTPEALKLDPQVAGTGQAVPALQGKVSLGGTCRTQGTLKSIGLSSAPVFSFGFICDFLTIFFSSPHKRLCFLSV